VRGVCNLLQVGGPEVEFELDSAIYISPDPVGTAGTVRQATTAAALGLYAKPEREP